MRRSRTDAKIHYDDALPKLVEVVTAHLGDDWTSRHAVLRDSEGALTLILRDSLKPDQREALDVELTDALRAYAGTGAVCSPEDLFDVDLADPEKDIWEPVATASGTLFIRLIERRIVGQDWMRGIAAPLEGVPPIVVFASNKGGVGRSTAMAVASAAFAAQGKSILAIDLDLEAPGVGGMFTVAHQHPEFGALDYYVENGRGGVDDEFLDRMVAVSSLTAGRGQILVVPATGQRCRDFPQNVIGKLSRAYLENVIPSNATPKTFLDQTQSLVSDLCKRNKVDAVFIDARAGLNETTAATVQGLGADVLFFGVDTPQTWEGYRYFLAHLARFKPADDNADWRYRVRMVHAKASANPKAWSAFRDRAFDLFAEHLYDEADGGADEDDAPFSFDLDDPTAPHHAWPVLFDQGYAEFDPPTRPEQFSEPIYVRTFGTFLSGLAERLGFR